MVSEEKLAHETQMRARLEHKKSMSDTEKQSEFEKLQQDFENAARKNEGLSINVKTLTNQLGSLVIH